MQGTTAIAIVSISAGAVVALGGGFLNAQLARQQAARQFAHEREMADRADLRTYLGDVLTTMQDVVDMILGLDAELGALVTAVGDAGTASHHVLSLRRLTRGESVDAKAEALSTELTDYGLSISYEIEKLRTHLVRLSLMVGAEHALTSAFTRVLARAIACAKAVPEDVPPNDASRRRFTEAWEQLADEQRDFLALAADLVGVRLG